MRAGFIRGIAHRTAFPEPTEPPSAQGVLLDYLDFFRARVLEKVASLPKEQRRHSIVASGWTPLELINHLIHAEQRWLEWRYEGADVSDPWADERDGQWWADADLDELADAVRERATRTKMIVSRHRLDENGVASDRWPSGSTATLERVLLHLVQEYARHLGQLDIVVEFAGGEVGE